VPADAIGTLLGCCSIRIVPADATSVSLWCCTIRSIGVPPSIICVNGVFINAVGVCFGSSIGIVSGNGAGDGAGVLLWCGGIRILSGDGVCITLWCGGVRISPASDGSV
jgi:hypothetical protein